MFDNVPLPYKFVQRNRNKHSEEERLRDPEKAYDYEYIYKFFVSNTKCKRKIIVEIKEYKQLECKLFKVDFYATTSNKDKKTRNETVSRYRYLTKVGKPSHVLGTVLRIVNSCSKGQEGMAFGFQAATSPKEKSDNKNKRYNVYHIMMQLLTGNPNNNLKVFGYPENSYIFVLRKGFLDQKHKIIEGYGRIFGKIFDTNVTELQHH